MTEAEISISIRLSAQRALLGAITPNIQQVTLDWDGLENFTMRVYLYTTPTEEELEDMEVVTTEIIADIPFASVDPVEVIVLDQQQVSLSPAKVIVYLRK